MNLKMISITVLGCMRVFATVAAIGQKSKFSRYGDDTEVAAHESICNYCLEKSDQPARPFGHYHRINDDEGHHAHIHKCENCGDKFVCLFECTLRDGSREHHEKGMKSRGE